MLHRLLDVNHLMSDSANDAVPAPSCFVNLHVTVTGSYWLVFVITLSFISISFIRAPQDATAKLYLSLKAWPALLWATHHCSPPAHVTPFYREAHWVPDRSTRSNISMGLISSKSPLNTISATLMFNDQATMHDSDRQQYAYVHPSTKGCYCGELYISPICVNLCHISEQGYRLKIQWVGHSRGCPPVPLDKMTDPCLSLPLRKVPVLQEFGQWEQART